MEKITHVGVWPVGLVGGLMVEKPICDKATNKVIGFNSAWKPDRPFPIDMAGFAFNLKLLFENKDAWFSFESLPGHQESEILKQITTRDELQPLADLCTKVIHRLYNNLYLLIILLHIYFRYTCGIPEQNLLSSTRNSF